MSSNNQESMDQAEILRKRMEENNLVVENKTNEMIDTSMLPPRSEVHRQKEDKKTKIRIRYPIVRFLALVFIVIVCLIPVYHLYWQDDVEQTNSEPSEKSNVDVVEMKNNEPEVPEVKDEYEFAPPKEEQVPENTEVDRVSEDGNSANSQDIKEDIIKNDASTNAEAGVSNGQPSVPVQANEETYIIHVVKPSETLYRISMTYFKSRNGEAVIKNANGLDANGTVFAGQRLKIPIKQSK